MKTDYCKAALKHVLCRLENQKIPSSKIAVQKALFYLQEKGWVFGVEFEAHSYGPFSQQVAEAAYDLARDEEVIVNRTSYGIGQQFADILPDSEKQKMDTHLDRFFQMLNGDFSFKNFELFGTTLYCMRALQENGMMADQTSVIEEFKAWKGRKYRDEEISRAYDALIDDFPVETGAFPPIQ